MEMDQSWHRQPLKATSIMASAAAGGLWGGREDGCFLPCGTARSTWASTAQAANNLKAGGNGRSPLRPGFGLESCHTKVILGLLRVGPTNQTSGAQTAPEDQQARRSAGHR